MIRNRIATRFLSNNKAKLNVYFTAGFPAIEDTISIIGSLEKAGVDFIEVGIPFSDPLADGATIQQSSERAISNGMQMEILFNQLEGLRPNIKTPIILMGYLNSVLQYGVDRFIQRADEVGIDGLIFPDLPPHEFDLEWKQRLDEKGIGFSFLVTPETKDERVRYLDQLSSGFLYAVSSSSTTGTKSDGANYDNMEEYLSRLKRLGLKNPIMAGFGIHDKEGFDEVNKWADGAIIGSAFIRHLSEHGASEKSICSFVQQIKG